MGLLTAKRAYATNKDMDIQKAIDLIEKSEHVALLLPTEPDVDALVSAEVLGRILETAGKEVGVINTPGHVKQPPHRSLKKLAASGMLPKEFVVSLDTSNHPVSQLRYETEENRINVIFSPRTASLKEPLVSFREGRILCDVVFALGIPDIEAANHTDLLGPAFFTETPIINIDVAKENKQYGEVDLVDPEKAANAEIVYELAVALKEEPLEQELATLILAGILQKTNRFTSPETRATTFTSSSELMRLGADLAEAVRIASGEVPLSLLQLAGRSAVRTKADERGVLWSFITADDFEKTGRSSRDVSYLVRRMTHEFPLQRIYTLLWQEPRSQTIHATLAGESKPLEALRHQGVGAFQSPHLFIERGFKTFREAEEKISALLTGVL